MRKLGFLVLGAFVWGAAGCGYPNHRHDLRIREPVAQNDDALSLALLQSTGAELLPGNSVELVQNGRVFDVLEKEISLAEKSINIVVFIWRKSAPSDRLIEAIAMRTKEGVKCRVVVDPIGSVRFYSEVRSRLSEIGCDVREFRPVDNRADRVLPRNHRKIVLIDGKRALTGGFGIFTSWMGDGLREQEWRDDNVMVGGPVVRQMQLAFAENWQEAGGALMGPEEFPEIEPAGELPAAFIKSSSGELSDAERMTLLTIAAAKKRLWIANSYFIPNTAIGDMLIEKVKQGVDVRVLCPGPVHDLPPLRAGQRSTYARLLEAGVRIWEYQPSMMHSKTMIVDDELAVVGSTNLDVLSMQDLEEGSLVVKDPLLVKQLEESFEKDVQYSLEIRWSWWKKRGLVERIPAQLTPIFGRFL